MKKDYTNIIFIVSELAEFYTKNEGGKGSGFGQRLIELYANTKLQRAEAQRDELLEAAKGFLDGELHSGHKLQQTIKSITNQ